MSDERSTLQVNVTGDGNVVGNESLAQMVKAENGSIIGDVVQIGRVITHLFSSGIFDAYVCQIFERRGTDQYYSWEQTLHWLSRLAQRVTEKAQSVFLIERIQPDWLPTRTQRWLRTVCVMLVTGIPIGLLVGLGAGLPVWLTDGGRGWTFGLRVGLASALAVWLAAGRTFGPTGGLLVGSAFGLAFGMTFGDFFGQSLGWAVGVAVGVTAGLAFGLGGGRVAGGSVAGGDKIVVVEKLKWLWPRAIPGLIIGLIAGGILGQTVWQAVGRFFDPGFGWTFGMAFGLASGLVAGLFSGLTSGEVENRT